MHYVYDSLGTSTLETGANDYVQTYNCLVGGYGTIASINYNGASLLSYTYNGCGLQQGPEM